MKDLIIALALLGPVDWNSAVLYLTGSSSMEDLTEETLDHFTNLKDHPIDLNHATRSQLSSSGLLNQFQIASLMEYRSEYGDVLSFKELELVDGFGPQRTEALKPFVRLEAGNDALKPRDRNYSHTITAKHNLGSGRIKYCGELGNVAELNLSSGLTGSAAWYSDRMTLMLGDMNAKFGQGLLLWTGMSLSGFSSADFSRNGSGAGASSGFSNSGRIRGAGAIYDLGNLRLSALGGIDGSGAARAEFLSKTLSIGVNGIIGKGNQGASVDWKMNVKSVDIYGESAVHSSCSSVAGVLGLSWSPVYGDRFSILARHYPGDYAVEKVGAQRSASKVRDETGITAGACIKGFTATADYSLHPEKDYKLAKVILHWQPTRDWSFAPGLRFQARYKSNDSDPLKLEFKGDGKLNLGRLYLDGRVHLSECKSTGILCYGGIGWQGDSFSAYSRAGFFDIDNWADRIYVYEKDAPGNYNVPAYYGQGYMISLYAAYKKKLYLRAATVQKAQGEPKWELRLQYVHHFFHSNSARPLDKNKPVRRK